MAPYPPTWVGKVPIAIRTPRLPAWLRDSMAWSPCPSSMRPAFTSGVAYAESSLGGCIAFTAGSSLSGTQD